MTERQPTGQDNWENRERSLTGKVALITGSSRDIGAEIAMCLDEMPLLHHSKNQIAEAVRKTSLWAERCKIHHDYLAKDKSKKQLLFAISQGGIYSDLRKKCCKELKLQRLLLEPSDFSFLFRKNIEAYKRCKLLFWLTKRDLNP